MYIKPDGSLELRVPVFISEAAVKKFLRSAGPWLQKKQQMQERAAANILPPDTVTVGGVLTRIQYSPFCRCAVLSSPGLLTLPGVCRDSAELRKKHLVAFYRKQVQTVIFPMVKKYAAMLGREIRQLRVTGAATRWGSCSGSGRINISWRTARLPENLAELVAAHEAAHLAEMNHSKKFYAVLESLLPDRAVREEQLKKERLKYADQ